MWRSSKPGAVEEKPAAPVDAEPKKEVVASQEEAPAAEEARNPWSKRRKRKNRPPKLPVANADPKPARLQPDPRTMSPWRSSLPLPEVDQSQLGRIEAAQQKLRLSQGRSRAVVPVSRIMISKANTRTTRGQ